MLVEPGTAELIREQKSHRKGGFFVGLVEAASPAYWL